jgi:excinuclease ABC subunit C
MHNGQDVIRKSLIDMPNKAGIYQMLDSKNNILYIGKARNLANRIAAYAKSEGLSNRIAIMVSQVSQIKIIVTNSELDALLLEANLIKHNKPKYNILLKDDKSFSYISLTSHEFPRINRYRAKKRLKEDDFGPFISAFDVKTMIELIQKLFLIRPCSDSFFSNRERPCIQYQIKKCSAPCVGKVSQIDYQDSLEKTKQLLLGRNTILKDQLIAEMENASVHMEYEKAALIRDKIRVITNIQSTKSITINDDDSSDFIAIHRAKTQSSIQIFMFRHGNNIGNLEYFPEHDELDDNSEIMASFLLQFYQKHDVPAKIYIENNIDDIVIDAIKAISKSNVKIIIPKSGEKFKILKQVAENAEISFKRKLADLVKNQQVFDELAKQFNLSSIPNIIEVYDNSHISGTSALGAMIVVTPEGFNKKLYRKFDYKDTLGGGDDYAMLRETLKQRIIQIKKDNNIPDFWLIDGGKGHMNIVVKIQQEYNMKIPFACIAKGVDRNAGNETFHMIGIEPFTLAKNSELMKFLQRIRDEAHRFAITSHRTKRSKRLKQSSLDALENIGVKRKKLLINFFGSPDAVKNAAIEDIMKVPNIGKKIAEKIYEQLH